MDKVANRVRTKPTLRDLLIEQNKVESRLKAALKREYPLDSIVTWTHGEHVQRGRVIDYSRYDARLRAENVRTGKQKWLTASEIHHSETGEYL